MNEPDALGFFAPVSHDYPIDFVGFGVCFKDQHGKLARCGIAIRKNSPPSEVADALEVLVHFVREGKFVTGKIPLAHNEANVERYPELLLLD